MATKKKYNLLGAVRAMAEGKQVTGLEREVSCEMEKLSGRKCLHNGIMLPDPELCREMNITGFASRSTAGAETLGRPAHGVIDGIGGNGNNLVATDLYLDLFIEALTARTVFGKVGISMLDGLVGNVAIPAGGEVEADWIPLEGGEVGKKNPTFEQRTATPKTVAAFTEITRSLMVQTSNAAEAIVVGILQNAIARAIEKAGFLGTGKDGEPRGLANTPGVQSVAGITAGAVTKADLVKFWSMMETENANTDAAAFIMSPTAKGLLARTIDYTALKNGADIAAAVSAARYLYERGNVEDYPAFSSNLCDPKKIYFGDWSQLLLCSWRGMELMVDPYSKSITGAHRVVVFNDCDFIVRQPKAFVMGTALA